MNAALRASVLCGVAASGTFAWAAERDYQVARGAGGDYQVTASYLNLGRDPLSIGFALPQELVRESIEEFGFDPAETRQMAQSCNCTQQQYDERVDAYYRDRAVAWRTESGVRHLYVDVPAVVARNRLRLRALAGEFDKLVSARHYGQDDALGSMITFVQAALVYQKPPNEENGRNILGFYPPLRALEAGSGDCDTKSALLAAILTNFPGVKMIGVHVPRHYLVGIARVPRQGDAFIEYRGEPFVLIEASGPGRLPPGTIGATTQAALETMNEVRIDPLF